jgi:CRP/FNR family transcriptional regulator/CRP/FNR family cyclic AMP-dependent transcriptional regulator
LPELLEVCMSKAMLLRRVPLFASLSDQEIECVAATLGKRTFGKGIIIFHKGSPGRTMYIVEQGKVRIFLLSDSGHEISVNVYGPGDTFGEMAVIDNLPRSAGAVALDKSVVYTLLRDDFLRHLETFPHMARGVMDELCARLRYTTAQVESLAFLDVPGRVAEKLLELADRYGADRGETAEIELQLTQSELATWVVATREHVNRALSSFRDEGLIAVDGQRVTILDRAGLGRRIMS